MPSFYTYAFFAVRVKTRCYGNAFEPTRSHCGVCSRPRHVAKRTKVSGGKSSLYSPLFCVSSNKKQTKLVVKLGVNNPTRQSVYMINRDRLRGNMERGGSWIVNRCLYVSVALVKLCSAGIVLCVGIHT